VSVLLLSLEHGYLLIASQKTASESLHLLAGDDADLALSRISNGKHLRLDQVAELIEASGLDIPYPELFVFAVVREPAAWYVSWYNSRGRAGLANPENPRHKKSTRDVSFDEFLEAAGSQDPPPYTQVRPQTYFLRTGPVSAKVHPIAFEELTPSLGALFGETSSVLSRLDWTNPGNRKNRSKHVRIRRDELSESQVRFINEQLHPEDYAIYRAALDAVPRLKPLRPAITAGAAAGAREKLRTDAACADLAFETAYAHALSRLFRGRSREDVRASISDFSTVDTDAVIDLAEKRSNRFQTE
jgi:hypothetical protein